MYIYKISNKINNKVYIGQTIRPIEERLHRHINDALNNIIDTHFARAIRLYGSENFYIELLDTATSQEELTLKEQQWIKFYNSVEEGYNETDAISKCGGNTYKSKTAEEKKAIGEKIRQSKLGGKNPQAVGIKCKNIETDKEYFFSSMAEAARYFNQTNHQFISRRCRGEVKNLYEGKWMFAYQDKDYGNFTAIPNANRSRQVLVLNLETKEQFIYNTCNAVDTALGFSKGYTNKKLNASPEKKYIRNNYEVHFL